MRAYIIQCAERITRHRASILASILTTFRGQGLILEARGPILKISRIFMILKTLPVRKGRALLRPFFDTF